MELRDLRLHSLANSSKVRGGPLFTVVEQIFDAYSEEKPVLQATVSIIYL